MSSLSILPIEVLELITGMVTTSDQMSLWQCGDRVLRIKLKNGGLKRTSLCWSGRSWMPWPRSYFTTFDGLVDVKWEVSIGLSLCPTLEFNLLPKTLRRLHLASEDVFILMIKQNVNMREMLPLLESLHLSGSFLSEKNLKNLPANLIELYVHSYEDEIKSSCIFGDLPRHLERLTLIFWIVDESEHENDLPSDLNFLHIYALECNFDWFSKLPKFLKVFNIALRGFYLNWLTLPPRLEELILQWPSDNIPISALPLLPKSLTTLQVPTIEDLTAEDALAPFLPKHLTRLVLTDLKEGQTVGHSALQQLPASLTDFDVAVPATHPDILSFYRPEANNIQIRGGTFAGGLKAFPLPTKLLSLELPSINDDICAMLPPGLQKLKIDGGFMTSKGASKLPKSLTSLSSWFEIFEDNHAMSYIGHVSNVELTVTQHTARFGEMNEHWLSSLLPSSSPRSSNQDCTHNDFNPHLTSLQVSVDRGFEITSRRPLIKKSLFDALPRFINLTTLKIWEFGDLSSDWLSSIPQSLTDLHICTLNTCLTATQLPMLPKGLRYLGFEINREITTECDWDDETIQLLPRSLQSFYTNCAFPRFTKRMYEYLPPNICFWDIYSISLSFPHLEPLYGIV